MGSGQDWINKNSAVTTIGAIVLLVVALGYVLFQNRGADSSIPTKVYFYDLGSNATSPLDRLFPGSVDEIGPIDAPSHKEIGGSPVGVRAWVMGCGSCKDKFIAYLEAYSPEASELLKKMNESVAETITPASHSRPMLEIEKGHTVRTIEGDRWVPYSSRPARVIIDGATARCADSGKPAVPCYPESE